MLSRRHHKKILLVHDDSVAALAISLCLVRRGYKVIPRTSADAFDWLHSEVPDLVILDMAIPGKFRLEVCRRLHESHATDVKPVIFLTAPNGYAEITEGRAADCDAYVVGPFVGDTLATMVEMFLTSDIPLTKKRPAETHSSYSAPPAFPVSTT